VVEVEEEEVVVVVPRHPGAVVFAKVVEEGEGEGEGEVEEVVGEVEEGRGEE